MDRQQFEKKWDQIKGKIRPKWNKLSDEEINKMNGKFDRFLELMKKKYGFNRQQVEKELRNWVVEFDSEKKSSSNTDHQNDHQKEKKGKAS